MGSAGQSPSSPTRHVGRVRVRTVMGRDAIKVAVVVMGLAAAAACGSGSGGPKIVPRPANGGSGMSGAGGTLPDGGSGGAADAREAGTDVRADGPRDGGTLS